MSSYNKRAKSLKRTHRERPQLSQRKHLGLLEKHQDYVLRARDYHQKQAHLKILREKARNRNPDEFYYKMINSKLRDGRHVIPQPEEKYSPEELQLMKTQDIKYVQMKLSTEKKKIERLQASLHQVAKRQGSSSANSHVIFVDTPAEGVALATEIECKETTTTRHVDKECSQNYKELEQRKRRCKDLERIVQKMTTKKQLTDKGKRIKIKGDGVNPPTYKWKKERKK